MDRERNNNYLREWRKRNRLLTKSLSAIDKDDLENNVEIDSVDKVSDKNGESDPGLDSVDESYSEPQISTENSSAESQLSQFSAYDGDGADNGDNDGSDDDNLVGECRLASQLAKWMLRNRITRSASDELLAILRLNGHEDLPKCSRTILRTPRNVLKLPLT